MSMPSPQYVLSPLRAAASELRDAALAAQDDFADGAKHAGRDLNAGVRLALGDVAESNARLQSAVDDVAASVRASGQAALNRAQKLRFDANRRFSSLRNRAIAGSKAALDDSLRYSRKAGQRLEHTAIDARKWASQNPHVVVAAVVAVCCVAVLAYRRRRMARLAAREKSARRKANGALHARHANGVASAKRREGSHRMSAAK